MNQSTKLLLFAVLLISFGSNISLVDAWLYPDQPFRIPITVNSPGTLTNYQVLIDLNSAVLNGDTNTQFWNTTRSDGKDIRFANQNDNTSLDYFREFFNDDQNAHLWVEIKSLSAGDQNIFMYYGSGNADDNSSFERTFIDDGNGNTILGWGLSSAGGSNWFSNGTQYQNDSTVGTQDMSRSPPQGSFASALSYAVSIELQSDASANSDVRYYLFNEGSVNTTYVQYIGSTNQIVFRPSGDDGGTCSVSITDGQLYDVNLTRDYTGTWRMYVNNTVCTITDSTDRSGSSHGFSHASDVTGRADNVFIKNTNTGGEPTYRLNSFQDDANSTFRVVDEETNLPLDANVTINSVAYDVNSNGYFDVNTALISFPATIQVSFTGYDTRTFTFLTAQGLINDSFMSLGLRTASESSDIDFQFFSPDETTILDNRIIRVIRNGVLSGRGLTNSTGNLTFNLAPQDSIYDFNILFPGSDINPTQYKYDAVTVTVNAPRNEANNSVISSPSGFNFDVGGLGLQNITGQTSFPFSTIFILGNTVDAYTLRVVDNNATAQQYFARNYIMQAKGDVSSVTITPYLIDIDEGLLVNLLVIDQPTNTTVSDVRVTLSIGINNSTTVVEDTTTDSTGIAQLVMLSQKEYDISITSPNQDINYFTGEISAATTSPTFFINYTVSDSNYTPRIIRISYAPKTDTVSGTNQTFDVNVTLDFNFSSIIVQAIDNNRIVSSTQSSVNPFNASMTLTLGDFNSMQVLIRTIVITTDQNTVINKTYTITSIGNGGLLNLVGLRDDQSPNNFLIFVVIGLIGLVGVMGVGIAGNNDSQVYVGAVFLGLLSFLFFREYWLYVIGAIAVGGFAWMWTRTNK